MAITGMMDIREAFEEGGRALNQKRGLGSIRQLEYDVLATLLAVVKASVEGATLLWFPMSQAPTVEDGRELRVIACWKSNDEPGRIASGEIYYLNRVVLDWEDEDRGMEIVDVDGRTTGWFERYEGAGGDVTFEPVSNQFVTHLGWTYMPTMPETGRG